MPRYLCRLPPCQHYSPNFYETKGKPMGHGCLVEREVKFPYQARRQPEAQDSLGEVWLGKQPGMKRVTSAWKPK